MLRPGWPACALVLDEEMRHLAVACIWRVVAIGRLEGDIGMQFVVHIQHLCGQIVAGLIAPPGDADRAGFTAVDFLDSLGRSGKRHHAQKQRKGKNE